MSSDKFNGPGNGKVSSLVSDNLTVMRRLLRIWYRLKICPADPAGCGEACEGGVIPGAAEAGAAAGAAIGIGSVLLTDIG